MCDEIDVKICVVGLGPAGLGAAIKFSKSQLASETLLVDSGDTLENRFYSNLECTRCMTKNKCNMISGIGGCSLKSGCKISLFPAGSKMRTIFGSEEIFQNKILESFMLLNKYVDLQKPNISAELIQEGYEWFRKKGFKYRYYDAYTFNTDDLYNGYSKMLSQISDSGMSVLLNTKILKITAKNDHFELLALKDNKSIKIITKYLILGTGRLGNDLIRTLNAELKLGGLPNSMDVGVRIEFPTDIYPDIDKYHKDLKILFNNSRTFCVCKGGKIVPYSLDGIHFSEGYVSNSDRTSLTNLAIMTRLAPSSHNRELFDEIKMRLIRISDGKLIKQNLCEYLGLQSKKVKSSSSCSYCIEENINNCFPPLISYEINESVKYFTSKLIDIDNWDKVTVFAPEIDNRETYFELKPDFSVIPGLYLIGECSGIYRGILQSFCSGNSCAENVIEGNI